MRRSYVAPIAMLAALAFALLVAGCGSGSSAGSASSTSAEASGPTGEGPIPHFTVANCHALEKLVEKHVSVPLKFEASPKQPQSRCGFTGKGVYINIFLEAAFDSTRTYQKRLFETTQFGAPHLRKIPHPVRGVGDPEANDGGAFWVPSLRTLFAVRDRRYLTTDYSVPGSNAEIRDQAKELSIKALAITPVGQVTTEAIPKEN